MTWARAMGHFIRVCREEWAGLTRAQLAIAVTHACQGKARVTPAMVEAWEKGQPPRTSAELVALTTVLSRHGLGPAEATDLYKAACVALAERQYPELLLEQELSLRRDIDAVLESAYVDACAYVPLQTPILWLVGVAKELETVVFHAPRPRPDLAHQRSRERALAFARAALAERVARRDGLLARWAAQLLETNADYIESRWGMDGLGGRLSVLGQRTLAAFHRAHGLRSESDVKRLFALSEAAEARGEKEVAAYAHLKGVHCLAELQPGSAATRIASAVPLPEMAAGDRRHEIWAPHLDLIWACLAEGQTEEADRYLNEFEQWWGSAPALHTQCFEARAQLALQRGEADTAEKWSGWANHSTSRWRR